MIISLCQNRGRSSQAYILPCCGDMPDRRPPAGEVVQSVKVPDCGAGFEGPLFGIAFSPTGCLYVYKHQKVLQILFIAEYSFIKGRVCGLLQRAGLQRFRGATLEFLGNCDFEVAAPQCVACCQGCVIYARCIRRTPLENCL